jgi:hypothetical protein
MYAREHAPPHFHAHFAEYEASFKISNGEILEGRFPKNQKKLVQAWAVIYKRELMENWELLTSGKDHKKINPMR